MSSPLPRIGQRPLIALIDRANRAFQNHMVEAQHRLGHPVVKHAHNAVFGTLLEEGSRASDMATRAGITRQSMGEVVREMVDLGILEMQPDPEDRRAKLVTYTDEGRALASDGYQHLIDLEKRFADEFGEEEYALVRKFLERLVPMLEEFE